MQLQSYKTTTGYLKNIFTKQNTNGQHNEDTSGVDVNELLQDSHGFQTEWVVVPWYARHLW